MNKKKFDWYSMSQRFSIRKYHFGAASVVLGTLLSLGIASSDASANNSGEVQPAATESSVEDAAPNNVSLRSADSSSELAILNIDIAESTVTILTENAVKVEATLDGKKVSLSGANGTYSFERPVSGGNLTVKVTDKNGVEKTQTTKIEPITTEGTINVNNPGIDVTNDFDLKGITQPAKKGLPSETNVLYAGTELDSISTDKIVLNSTSWTQLASGWQKDNTYPLAGHYVLSFQNPKFYENIESISVNNVQFEKYNGNPSTWSVELLTKTFSTGLIGTKYENKIVVKLKNGQTLTGLGLDNKAISFTSGWVTGKDYKKSEGINKLVAESIDNSWFSTNNQRLNDSDNGVRNNFTGTKKDAAANVPPIMKVLPDLHGDTSGVANSIKSVYIITPSGAYGLLGVANSYQTLPYFVQQIPKALLPFIDSNNISIYQSNSSGNILDNKQRFNITANSQGIVDSRTNSSLTIAGKSSQADVDRVRNFFSKNLFSYTLGQPLYITVEYGLKNPKNSVELAKELNKIIKAQNGTLNFEGWMGRETKSGTNQVGANEPGVLRGSYANSFLDTNLLTLNAPDKQTYDVSYEDSTVEAGKQAQAIIPKITDISSKQVEVPSGSTFTLGNTPNTLSNVSIDSATGVITATVADNTPAGTEILIPVTLTYPDGTVATVNAKITVINSSKDADTYEPEYPTTNVVPGTPATSTPIIKNGEGNTVSAPEGTKFKIDPLYTTPNGYTVEIDGNTGVVTVKVQGTLDSSTLEELTVPVLVTYPDTSEDNVIAKFLLDTDGDGTPDVDDEDDDNDGVKDTDEGTDGTNPKDPNSIASSITPIDDQTLKLGEPITNVTVTVNKLPNGGSVKVEGLPDGVTFDPTTKTISGTPTAVGESTVTVTVLDKDGNPVKAANGQPVTETFKITVTDPTTQADKYTPEYPTTNVVPGTPAKSTPTIKGEDGSTVPAPEGTKFKIDPSFVAPDGYTVTIDENTGEVTVTAPTNPTGETAEKVEVPVIVTYPDTSVDNVTANFFLDTDGDGTPDKDDEDDDNDGVKDTDEGTDGTNPKDPNSIASSITPIDDQTVKLGEPITNVTVTVNKLPNGGSVKVEGLPDGVTFDPTTKTISGTPTALGESTVTVTILDKDGNPVKAANGQPVTEEFKIKVVENPKQADTNEPKYEDKTGKPGETVKVPAPKNEDGSNLPDGSTFESNNPDVKVDPNTGEITVTVPETAKPGDEITSTITVTYPDGSKDEVPVKITVTEKDKTDADKYTPEYPTTNVVPGKPAKSTPTIKGEDGNPTTAPSGTKYGIDPSFKAPDGYTVTIDENTGEVTVTAPANPTGETAEKVEVPVIVTYPDTSVDNVTANFFLDTDGDGTPDKDDEDDDNDGVKDTDEGTDGTNPKDPNSIASSITPIDDQTVKLGQPIKEVTVVANKVPTGGSIKVEGLPDGVTFDPTTKTISGTPTALGESTVTVTILDKDGNPVKAANGQPVTEEFKIKVVENPKQADTNEPKYEDKTGKPGETVTIPAPKNEDGSNLPDGSTFESNNPDVKVDPNTGEITVTVPETAKPGDEITSTITVTYPDGSKDEVPVKITVTEKDKTDADKYTPEYPTTNVVPGTPAKSTPTIKGEDGSTVPAPEGTKFKIDPNFKVPDGYTVTIDENTGVVTVTAPENPTGDTAEKVEVPIIVTYPDTSIDNVTANFFLDTDGDGTPDVDDEDDDNDGVKDTDEGTDGTNPKDPNSIASSITPIDDQTIKLGEPIANVTVTVNKLPNGGSVKVEGLPDGVTFNPTTKTISGTPTALGESTVTVTVLDKDGNPVKAANGQPVTEEFKIKVVENPKQADTNEPKYEDKTGKPGETVKVPAPKNENGSNLPDGSTFESSNPDVKVDPNTGEITVTVPETAKPGDEITSTITVTYPDGSKDEVPVKITVTEKDKTDAEENTPKYEDKTGKPGETVKVPAPKNENGSNLPDGSTFESNNPDVKVDPNTGEITVTVPETAKPGDEITSTITVTYPDGSKDELLVKVTVTNPDQKSPSIKDIGDKTVIEKQPIDPIKVETTDVPKNGTVEVNGLPGGLTYNPETGEITGTPTVTDWGKDEEERDYTVTVEIKDETGNVVATEDFVIKVQRDTDGDKIPDVTDPDDDNDGYTDEEEKAKGTDPKDPNSKPTTPVVPGGKDSDGGQPQTPETDSADNKDSESKVSKKLSNTGETTTTSAAGLVLLALAGLLGRRKKDNK